LDPADVVSQVRLHELEAELSDAELVTARQAQVSLRSTWLQDGDRCSKRFFSCLKQRSTSNQITALRSSSGQALTHISDILQEATDYYCLHLNEAQSSSSATAATDRLYLLSHLSETLDPLLSTVLDSPITAAEIGAAIKEMPGPDGIPSEFFQIFSDLTVPLLVDLYNYLGRLKNYRQIS
jgi:hypothetical protein